MAVNPVDAIDAGLDVAFDVSALPRTEGHLLIVFLGGIITDVPDAPAGWVEFDVSPRQSSSHVSPALFGYYKILGAGEPISYDFDNGASSGWVSNFLEYSGVDPDDPIAATSAADNGNATVILTLPAVTVEREGSRLIIAEHNQLNLIPSIATWTTRVDGFFMFSFDKAANAGSSGDIDVVSANESGTGWDIGFLIALNPAVEAGQRFDCAVIDSQIN